MRTWFVLTATLALLACARPEPVTQIDLLAFSTTVSFSIYAPPDGFHDNVVPALEQRMQELEVQWRSFGDGALATLNHTLESGGCTTTDSDTLELVLAATEYARQSNGLFDPTLGLAVDAWGFRDYDQIESAVAPKVKGKLTIEGTRICSDAPLRIDLGGIAKGAIVLELAQLLETFNVHNAIINVGGDLLVLGTRGDKPWRVAIQHPRKPGVIARIDAADGDAIFSSGDYHRRAIQDGKVTHHILDPRTQAPSTGAIATTVIHANPLLADAAATALLVAGVDEYEAIANKLNITRAVLIDQELGVHSLPHTDIELPTTLTPAR